MRRRSMVIVLAVLCLTVCAHRPAAGYQMFKPNPGGDGVSAYLVSPSDGVTELPAGWTRDTSLGHANCLLARHVLVSASDAGALTTTSYELPRTDYEVSLCCIGSGKARLAGTEEWVSVGGHTDSYYRWTRLGTVKDATSVAVEVAPAGKTFRYAGLVAEGRELPVKPVADVLAKLRKGDPVTICLVGDSVTENAKGHRGGSSGFDTGNPGAFKLQLEEEFSTEVSYISHREPPGWPDDGDIEKISVVEIDGQQYRDGRVAYDASQKIRLVNMGKGGAASDNAWLRFADTFTEPNDWRLIKNVWRDTSDTKLPPVLRYGVAHYEPDLVIINFGTNDANGSHVGWTPEDYLFNMKVLATMAQHDLGAAVILATPHKWTRGTHQNPHTQPDMTEAIRDYAARSGFAFADVYNEYGPDEYDGIHPGDAGHKHIADAYMGALIGWPSEPRISAQIAASDLRDNGDGTVTDTVHALTWAQGADAAGGAVDVARALEVVQEWNQDGRFGRTDWRLPTRDELLVLIDPAQRPALPPGHAFQNVQRHYLTSSVGMNTAAGPLHWYVDVLHGLAYFPTNRAPQTGHLWLVCPQTEPTPGSP